MLFLVTVQSYSILTLSSFVLMCVLSFSSACITVHILLCSVCFVAASGWLRITLSSINVYLFVCLHVHTSDEEKSATSEKYLVVECVDSDRTGISSAADCYPKSGSDTTYTHHLLCTTHLLAYIYIALVYL